ncbi:uncharacterized protein LOC6650297 [Drosophila willistoni]|nr:uncharacterized protein LOC6650297 [Drosophila willistoni]
MAGRRVFSIILLAYLLLLTVVTALDHGAMLCSNDNAPVCARGNGEYLLFKNECDLRKAQNENLIGGPLFDVALQYCIPACDFECGKEFRPVCGVSVNTAERKTFTNRCEMARASCTTKSDWLVYKWDVCPTKNTEVAQHTVLVGERKRTRPVPCTNIYRPVCATYAGVKSTFSNECLVNAENIKTQRNWRIVSEGLCGEDSTKMKHNRKYKPKAKPKEDSDRTKRSHKKRNQVEDFQIAEDAVEIFAPSTFHTQFISNTGTMVKSYSLPARKPVVMSQPKIRTKSRAKSQAKPCVFSNEPVCGSFNGESRTFSNVCSLMEFSQRVGNAWTILHEGSCRHCDAPCPNIYSPICANRNGINYTIINKCYLERVRCKDPNSSWKIIKDSECDEISKGLPTESSRQSSLIPKVLYTSKDQQTSTTKLMYRRRKLTTTAAPTKTNALPRRKLKKISKLTDNNNRKIRKIDLSSFEGYQNSLYDHSTEVSKMWSSNDNWLIQQTLDNVKSMFNKKPASFAKSQSEKQYYYYPINNMELTTVPPEITTTQLPINMNELLNLANIDSKMFDVMDEELIRPTTTIKAPRRVVTTSKPKTTTPLPVPASTSLATTTTTTEASTQAPEETTTAPGILSTSTEPTTTTSTDASVEDATTKAPTNSDDYMAEEQQSSPRNGQTSIYGLDKDSLIMRLLRARSRQNVVI